MMKFILLKTAIIMTLIICFATSLKLAYDGSTFRHSEENGNVSQSQRETSV